MPAWLPRTTIAGPDPVSVGGTINPVRRHAMTVCPIAIAVGCKKCPAFAVCPLKNVIGDYRKEDDVKAAPTPKGKAGKASK